MKRLVLLILTTICLFAAVASEERYPFAEQAQKKQFYVLLEELRCLVCQNQTLADSDALLAQDLRDEVYQMVQQGQQNEEIVGFLVERYGDFVLYNPPLKLSTYVLWFGPFFLLIAGLLFLIAIIFYQRKTKQSIQLTEKQHQQAKQLLTRTNREGKS